jgi:antitoxin (DNA-binding transcriptional repressor) of toxin-antitoxin stability system
MKAVSVRQAKAQLSSLINDLADEVFILNRGRPVAVLRAVTAKDAPRVTTAVAERLRAELTSASKKPSVTLEEYRAGKRSYPRKAPRRSARRK